MFSRLNHIAIIVSNLETAARRYEMLGADIAASQDLPEHRVRVVFITLPNTKIELLQSLDQNIIHYRLSCSKSVRRHTSFVF